MADDDPTESSLDETCDMEYGILNPPANYDDRPILDIDDYDPVMLVSKVAHETAYEVQEKKDNRYYAIVMRVDESINNYCEVKARIPEKDGMKPEPTEFVERNILSNSHYLIDQHRTYSWRGAAPKIGDKILVSIPDDGSSHTKGTILQIEKENYVPGRLKSAKVATMPAMPTAPNSLSLNAPSGDDVGSGSPDPASQIPPYSDDMGATSLVGEGGS